MKAIIISLFILIGNSLFAQAGRFDSTFGSSGQFVLPPTVYQYNSGLISAEAIQPDGKILLAGYNNVYRLNNVGTLDSSFGTNGHIAISFAGASSVSLKKIAVQPNGKIVITGTISYPATNYIDSLNTYNDADIAVVRLNANGSYDLSFNSVGFKIIDLILLTHATGQTNHSNDQAGGLSIRSNGKILVGGQTFNNTNSPGGDWDATLVQLNSNGSFDTNFNKDGIQILKKKGTNEFITGIALQPDGKTVMAGYINSGGTSTSDILTIRVNTNGSLDNAFKTKGYIVTDVSNASDDHASSVILQPDGKILIGGTSITLDGSTNAVLIRLNSNGQFDNSFGANGISAIVVSYDNPVTDMALQSDNKIIQISSSFTLFRYNTNGSLDTTFGTNGANKVSFTVPPASQYGGGYAVAVAGDGRIVAAGNTNIRVDKYTSGTTEAVVRLLPNANNGSVKAPKDTTASLQGNCVKQVNNIDPILSGSISLSDIKYYRYNQQQSYSYTFGSVYTYTFIDSGSGSASGKTFLPGTTTRVIYVFRLDPSQQAAFDVTITGGTPATALDFDGIDDRVELPAFASASFPSASHLYTLEAWVKVRGYNKNGGSVIFSAQQGSDSGVYAGINENGYINTYHPNTGLVTSGYQVPLNTWTHIAFVQSPNSLSLFVNGSFVQTLLSSPHYQVKTANKAYIGAYTNNGTTFTRQFNGQIDNMRMWTTALCETQIQSLLNKNLDNAGGVPGNLITEYSFNNAGTIAGCVNTGDTLLTDARGTFIGYLKNFFLQGPSSNWVDGSGPATEEETSLPALTLSVDITNTNGYRFNSEIQITCDSGTCGAYAYFTPVISNLCNTPVNISYTFPSGTYLPTSGTEYADTVTVADSLGNVATYPFTIGVFEYQAPQLVTKDTSIMLNQNGTVVVAPKWVISSVSDNCTPTKDIVLAVTPNHFNTKSIGANTVTVTARDLTGNIATQKATVTILPYSSSAGKNLIVNSRKSLQTEFTVIISPNPSKSDFNIQVKSSNLEDKITIRVTDEVGRMMDILSNVNVNEVKKIGAGYKVGIYFAEIIQGTHRKIIKLVRI